jgi:hypothetical protein
LTVFLTMIIQRQGEAHAYCAADEDTQTKR